jgi:hypothetical protein
MPASILINRNFVTTSCCNWQESMMKPEFLLVNDQEETRIIIAKDDNHLEVKGLRKSSFFCIARSDLVEIPDRQTGPT